MTGNRRWLACWLIASMSWSSSAIAAPASTDGAHDRARSLHAEAIAAKDSAQFEIAAAKFEAAHDALPDSCSPSSLNLLAEADQAYRQAYAHSADPLLLCRDERMLFGAMGDGSCEANSAAIGDLLRALRKYMLRDKVACPTATPMPRSFDESLPTAMVDVPQPPPPSATRLVVRQTAPRRGASISGAVLLGFGAAATATLAVAAWRGAQTERDIEQLLDENTPGCMQGALTGDCQRLDQQGQTMNRLAIASGVLAGALIVTGVALLIVGRRQAARRAAAGAVASLPGLTWRF